MKKILLIIVLFYAPTLFAQGPVQVSDDAGKLVNLKAPAQRVISLAPHLTELLYAIGAGDRLVGTVQYSDYPAAAKAVPRVGSGNALDLETIVALQPDLVLAWQSGTSAGLVEKLRGLGIRVFLSEPRRLEDVASNLRQLGELLGRQQQAQAVSADYLARLQALRARYQSRSPVSVFYEIWHQPLMTINGEHIISQVITLCGGRNIFADLSPLAPKIGLEAVLARDPQVIVAGGVADKYPQWKEDWQRWSQVSAVRNQHLFYVNPDIIQRHTLRILQGAEILCRQLEQVRAADDLPQQ